MGDVRRETSLEVGRTRLFLLDLLFFDHIHILEERELHATAVLILLVRSTIDCCTLPEEAVILGFSNKMLLLSLKNEKGCFQKGQMGREADILYLMATIKNIHATQEKNRGIYFAGKPTCQQLTKEIL